MIFHTLPLFYLRTLILRSYARENYATVEIHLERERFLRKIPEQVCGKTLRILESCAMLLFTIRRLLLNFRVEAKKHMFQNPLVTAGS